MRRAPAAGGTHRGSGRTPRPRQVRGRPGPAACLALVAALALLAVACSGDGSDEGVTTSLVPRDTTSTMLDGTTSTDADPESDATVDLRVPVRLVDLDLALESPIAASAVPRSTSMVVAERSGRLHEVVVDGGSAERAGTLLDLRDRVGSTSSERGLLGVAVSPDARALVASYTSAEDGGNRVERYQLDGNPGALSVDPGSRRTLLEVDQPFGNHNGGHVAFGPDGMLYVGIGDGGSGGDPDGNAQDPTTLLGKLLRVDAGDGPLVPGDNPFANGRGGARPEIWLTGVRNPWRFSFDEATGDLWLADVGQDRWEEVDHLPAEEGAGRGANLGWDLFEGAEEFADPDPAAPPWSDGPFVEPVFTYGREDGCSVTGGLVYRGAAIPALAGAYLFADFCGEGVRGFDPADPHGTARSLEGAGLGGIVAFATTADAEVLVLSLTDGVHLLAPRV